MSKVYEYNGELYSEDFLYMENDEYEGDLYDLYWKLKEEGKCHETTTYYVDDGRYYDSPEELIEEEFSYLIKAGGQNEM